MIESPVAPALFEEIGNGLLKTIELKEDKFFLTELTEKQKDFIISHKKQGTLDIATIALGLECNNIILIGSVSKISTVNVGKYIGYFLGPDQGYVSMGNNHPNNRQIHYRDYGYTLERQEKSSAYVNICPDIRMSVDSLKRVVKSEYCCIWKKRS